MAVVLLPRSLVALFPGTPRRVDAEGASVAEVLRALDARVPGMWDRLCDAGPVLRAHINVYVAGQPAELETAVEDAATIHVIPAVSGG
ncbi:MAG TPA: MoaD/ThiS family protein [Candidatus Limnocylindrales bacterium]